MKALLRGWLATGLGSAVLMTASLAFAEGEPCYNDTDCPGAMCGGEVCNWNKHHAAPVGDKAYVCNPAGSSPKKSDGWCTTDDNCKCKAQGAVCKPTVYCSFTLAADAPMSTAGTGTGGTASTAGTSSTGGSAAGTAAGGTASKPPAEEESGGCSVVSPASTGGGIALALGLVGLGAAFVRRRR